MGQEGVEKVLEYLTDYLAATFNHPGKTMDDGDMLSYLCGVLQMYWSFGMAQVLSKSTSLISQEH